MAAHRRKGHFSQPPRLGASTTVNHKAIDAGNGLPGSSSCGHRAAQRLHGYNRGLPTVCAIVVTFNRKDLAEACLDSLLAQTHPVDKIVVVDNGSTDGTGELLDRKYPQVARLNLKENMGGAGGMCSGVRWSHCNKFDWTWVMHDGIRLKPGCLESMLSFGGQADMIQVRTELPGSDNPVSSIAFEPTEQCDFQGTLIGAKVIDEAGLPDDRYFETIDDTSYGYIAAKKTRSILLNYVGMVQLAPNIAPTNRATLYLSVRNRFLNRDNLRKSGLAPHPASFFFETLGVFISKLGEASGMSGDKTAGARAAIDGLRDGIYKRFDRIPRL